MRTICKSPGGVLHGVLHLQSDTMRAHRLHLYGGTQEERLRAGRLGSARARDNALLASLHQNQQRCEACA